MTSTYHSNTEGSSKDNIDLGKLLYRFDVRRPWQYFREGNPIVSSVEKGRRTLSGNSKLRKIYVAKKRKAFRRNNAAFNDLRQLVLTCCDSGCLLKGGVNRAKAIIRQQRNMLYEKPYNEQNYLLSKLMDITLTFRGKRKIVYHVPSLGKVCKTAFRKVYGFSRAKIQVLLKKIDLEGPSVEPDQRGQKTPRKLLPSARNAVTDFILSHEAAESHYRSSRTGAKRYFNSNISMRRMWHEFVRAHPHLQTTSLRNKNKGPVISFSAFRNIFNSNLKDVLSFRKPRLDTCQVCDKTKNRLDYLSYLRNRTDDQDEQLRHLINQKNVHIKESEVRFASLKYDISVLASKVSR